MDVTFWSLWNKNLVPDTSAKVIDGSKTLQSSHVIEMRSTIHRLIQITTLTLGELKHAIFIRCNIIFVILQDFHLVHEERWFGQPKYCSHFIKYTLLDHGFAVAFVQNNKSFLKCGMYSQRTSSSVVWLFSPALLTARQEKVPFCLQVTLSTEIYARLFRSLELSAGTKETEIL